MSVCITGRNICSALHAEDMQIAQCRRCGIDLSKFEQLDTMTCAYWGVESSSLAELKKTDLVIHPSSWLPSWNAGTDHAISYDSTSFERYRLIVL